jgi:excisionase family DNA binding protein
MQEDVFTLPDIPGYVNIKDAAKMLGVAESSVYRYIQTGRLQAYKAGRSIVVELETLKRFKPSHTGRPRKKAAVWHASPDIDSSLITYIKVQVRTDQQDILLKKLWEIKQEERHLFSDTVMRYISLDDTSPPTVTIQLVWKNSGTPNEKVRQREMEAFKAELADVLIWETAQYSTGKVIIHT